MSRGRDPRAALALLAVPLFVPLFVPLALTLTAPGKARAAMPAAADPASASAAASAPDADPVRRERVTFESDGVTLVGDLYLPSAGAAKALAGGGAKPSPVVVVGPWLNVKEQVATNYARRLAGKGFAALAFDFRHWGESGGEPREYESPARKIADVRAAVAFLKGRADLGGGKVGLLGVCFGAGYVAAASDDPSVGSVATVAAWVHDAPSVTALFGAEEVARRRKAGRAAKAAYAKDGTVVSVPAYSPTDREAAMFFPGDDFYYNAKAKRGAAAPQWTNRYAVLGWEEWLDFDGVALGAKVAKPLLVVHSDDSALPDNARRFFAAATGPKELLWTAGEHTQFYDTAPYVDRAADAVAGHFARTLLTSEARNALAARSLAAAREFFAALEAMDVPRFLRVWADDGVQEMPYAPGAFPKRLAGRAAIEGQYGPLPAAFDRMRFPLKRLAATDDPNTVVAEFDGSIGLKGDGAGRYDNRYVGVFTFENGLLKRYAEYFDPLTLVNAFPGAATAAGPLTEAARIEAAVTALGRAADAKDWAAVRAAFADRVDFDYTSVAGGSPAVGLAADALVAGWREGLGRYETTRHVFGGFETKVEGDAATCRFSGQATHVRPGGARWSCGGDYVYRFARGADGAWRATAARFTMTWEQGER